MFEFEIAYVLIFGGQGGTGRERERERTHFRGSSHGLLLGRRLSYGVIRLVRAVLQRFVDFLSMDFLGL